MKMHFKYKSQEFEFDVETNDEAIAIVRDTIGSDLIEPPGGIFSLSAREASRSSIWHPVVAYYGNADGENITGEVVELDVKVQ